MKTFPAATVRIVLFYNKSAVVRFVTVIDDNAVAAHIYGSNWHAKGNLST